VIEKYFELEVALRSTENWIPAEGVMLEVLKDNGACQRMKRGEYVHAVGPTGQRIMFRYVLWGSTGDKG
jgi:hypothetical protein